MKNSRLIESCVIFCCSLILICFVYLFWEQYSTAIKAGDIGILIAAVGAFIIAGVFYFQFKEVNRRFSQQRDDNQKWFQDQLEESRKHHEENQRQFQKQLKESQESSQERIQELQKLNSLAQKQFRDSQERGKESQRQFQELFNESRKQYEELFQKSQDIHMLSQKRHEESRKQASLALYRSSFSGLYDPQRLFRELVSNAESLASKTVPPVLLEILELIRINSLEQVIDESSAKQSLELALYDDFHDASPSQDSLLKYHLKAALLKYGLYLLEKDEDGNLQKRQEFLETIFKMKKIRVRDITAANIQNKLNIMDIANRV